MKPLGLIEKDKTDRFVNFFIDMGERQHGENLEVASEFVCRMYGQSNVVDVNEARHKKLMQMSGDINKVHYNPIIFALQLICCWQLTFTHNLYFTFIFAGEPTGKGEEDGLCLAATMQTKPPYEIEEGEVCHHLMDACFISISWRWFVLF